MMLIKKHAISGLVLLCLILLAFGSGGSSSNDRRPTGSGEKGSKASASVYCEQAVKNRLRAPKTAEFAGSWLTKTEFVKDLGGGKFEMRSYVDAQNGFGAMVRNNFVCEIHFTSRDANRIVKLDIQ